MTSQANAINWFEIPASNMHRAKTFYETIFGISMHTVDMADRKMAYFPADGMNGKVNGALVESSTHKSNQEGIKIYLNGNPDLQHALDKVEKAGGKIAMPKTKISDEVGHIAFIIDPEGNNVGLHSTK